jgi:hypothetical protein
MTEIILRSSEGYKFLFKVVSPVSIQKIQPSFAIPLPNTKSENQLLFRFAGQQEDVSFDFVLIPSDTDLSDGTRPFGVFTGNAVKTVKDQQIFLRDYVYGAGYDIGFWLQYDKGYTAEITGNIENMVFDAPPSSSSNYRTGRITFKRGLITGT